jgi:hypothetical protein
MHEHHNDLTSLVLKVSSVICILCNQSVLVICVVCYNTLQMAFLLLMLHLREYSSNYKSFILHFFFKYAEVQITASIL